MPGRQCSATTRAGLQCRRRCPPGELYCSTHSAEADAERAHTKGEILLALAKVLSLSMAASQAGVASSTAYLWCQEDPEFGANVQRAQREYLDRLETSVGARAMGVNSVERTFERNEDGELVETKRTEKRIYDTRAAELVLKAYDPRYRHDYQAPPPAPVPLEDDPLWRIMSDPEASALLDAALEAVEGDA